MFMNAQSSPVATPTISTTACVALCESDRGEWGEICPDCQRRLPPRPGPLQSWHAARVNDAEASERSRRTRSPLRLWHL
jgi:hypothetical protein